MTAAGEGAALSSPLRRFLLLASLCLLFMISQMLRSSVAVIAPRLIADLGLAARDLGLLSAAFFIVFAAFQLPVGIMIDRYGARLTICITMVAAVAGSWLFALSENLADLALARAFMGFGTASVLMGSLIVVSRWYSLQRYGQLASILIAAGNIGSIMSTTPLAFGAETIGWRAVFWLIGFLTLIFIVLGLWLVRDHPGPVRPEDRRRESLRQAIAGLGAVFANGQIRYVFAISLVSYSSLMVVLGLWGGPYLHDVHGLDAVASGNVLLTMSLAMISGALAYGHADRLGWPKKRLVHVGGVFVVGIYGYLALRPETPSLTEVRALFLLLGFGGAYGVVTMSHGRMIFPDRLAGRGITTLNLALMGGVALMQILTGVIVGMIAPAGAAAAPEGAYRAIFAFVALCTLAAQLYYTRAAEPAGGGDRAA